MSGLVDMWTSSLAKLREKGPAIFSSGSNPGAADSSQKLRAEEVTSLGSSTIGQLMRARPQIVLYSEASLSKLVECYSP